MLDKGKISQNYTKKTKRKSKISPTSLWKNGKIFPQSGYVSDLSVVNFRHFAKKKNKCFFFLEKKSPKNRKI
jgi:hypothetical protein